MKCSWCQEEFNPEKQTYYKVNAYFSCPKNAQKELILCENNFCNILYFLDILSHVDITLPGLYQRLRESILNQAKEKNHD